MKFDLHKFLTENKLTSNSQKINEDVTDSAKTLIEVTRSVLQTEDNPNILASKVLSSTDLDLFTSEIIQTAIELLPVMDLDEVERDFLEETFDIMLEQIYGI